jgi:AraC family transcriptional regulator
MFGVPPSMYRAAHRPVPESASGTHLDDVSGYRTPRYPGVPPVEVKALAPIPVVFLRHVGPYCEVGATWGRLMTWAGMRGLLGPGMKLIGIVHDDPDITSMDRIRYDAAVTVNRPVQPEGDFAVMEIAAGHYAIATHKGPYEELGRAYQRLLGGWLPKSGHVLRDVPAFELYLNSPQSTRPENLLTLIHLPLED